VIIACFGLDVHEEDDLTRAAIIVQEEVSVEAEFRFKMLQEQGEQPKTCRILSLEEPRIRAVEVIENKAGEQLPPEFVGNLRQNQVALLARQLLILLTGGGVLYMGFDLLLDCLANRSISI